jgi:hypothetical protein
VKDVGWFLLLDYLLNSLTIAQIALFESEIKATSGRIRPVQTIGPDNVPAFIMKKVHQVRSDEAFGACYYGGSWHFHGC